MQLEKLDGYEENACMFVKKSVEFNVKFYICIDYLAIEKCFI